MEPMAAPLTDDERQRIVALLGEGKSARAIADEVGRSTDTVSRIARAIGHDFGRTNLARAQDARSAYCAERRALIAARMTEECELLLDQLHQPHLAYSFGGKDNTYEEHELSEPPVDAKRALIQSARECVRTVLEIDRHDNKSEGTSAFEAFLATVFGVGEAAA